MKTTQEDDLSDHQHRDDNDAVDNRKGHHGHNVANNNNITIIKDTNIGNYGKNDNIAIVTPAMIAIGNKRSEAKVNRPESLTLKV